MSKFAHEIKTAARSPLPYIVWSVLSVWLTVSGPFGTHEELPTPRRAAYWSGIVALSVTVGSIVRLMVEVRLERLPDLPRRLATAAAVALVLAPVLWAYSHSFPDARPPTLAGFAGFILLVALGLQLIRWGVAHHIIRLGPIQTPRGRLRLEEPDAQTRLLQRLKPANRGGLRRVSARDHYLDVYTEKGRAELLLRFSDALAELDGIDGAQVHRSHWVAWDAVVAAEREGTRLFLKMIDGARVPVSRTFQDAVVARGFLPGD